MTNEELWQAVLAQIQLNISPANFSTWFKGTGIADQKDDELVVSVPNSFAKEWLEQKYNKPIFKIINGLDKKVRIISYVVSKSELKVSKKTPVVPMETDQLEFQEFK
jgi:chromosomal replication initiator protein